MLPTSRGHTELSLTWPVKCLVMNDVGMVCGHTEVKLVHGYAVAIREDARMRNKSIAVGLVVLLLSGCANATSPG